MAIWKPRAEKIKKRLLNGESLQDIADHYKVSRQMIHLTCKRYLSDFNLNQLKKKRAIQKAKLALMAKFRKNIRDYGRSTYGHSTEFSRQCSRIFIRKKNNAKSMKCKWKFDIKFTDLKFPKHCPMLGIKLNYLAISRSDDSPSFDRVDTNKGYIKGNVIICSWRANRIKNNGTASEHRMIADFIDSHINE